MNLWLYRSTSGVVVRREAGWVKLGLGWDEIFRAEDPVGLVGDEVGRGEVVDGPRECLAPLEGQELWAAGVTYFSSRLAREEESTGDGQAECYRKVYSAARPELFFKAPAWRVAGSGGAIRIRRDSVWNVPEPELVLAITRGGRIFGYSVGNDVSSRSIEGENLLYLPQAKIFDGCAAVGPAIWVPESPPGPATPITLEVVRDGVTVFGGRTTLGEMKRSWDELRDYLFSELTFPSGVMLMTGTGIVPDPTFSLRSGDRVEITIDPIGTLSNTVA